MMDTACSPLRQDLDRATFHLEVLREVAALITASRKPRAILESVLLSAMGGVGAASGCAALVHGDAVQDCLCKGEACDTGALSASLVAPVVAAIEQAAHPILFDAQTLVGWPWRVAVALGVTVDAERVALLVLGPQVAGDLYDEEDLRFLHTLGILLQVSLRFAMAHMREELLTAQLLRRTEELDRQVFHLRAGRELALELGQGRNLATTLARAMPVILGHFALASGLLVLLDRPSGQVWVERRESSWQGDRRTADQLLFACLSRCPTKQVPPLHVEALDLEHDADLGVGFTPRHGFFFQVREGLFGVALLGAPLREGGPSDHSALLAAIQQLVLHLHGADAFATIVALNKDLEERNQSLQRTVDALTQAQGRIAKLESRVRQVLGAVEDKTWQVTRARLVDFIALVLLSAVLGLAFNAQNPQGVDLLPPYLPARVQVTGSIPQDAIVVDARPKEYYDREHLLGAVNLPPQFFDFVYPMLLGSEDPERPVAVYGRTWSRRYDVETARLLLDRGHETVVIVHQSAGVRP